MNNSYFNIRPVFRLFSILCVCIYAVSPVSAAYGGRVGVRALKTPLPVADRLDVFFCELVCSKLWRNNKTHDVAFCNKIRAITAGCLIGDPLLEDGRAPKEDFPNGRIAWSPPERNADWHLLSIHPIHSPPLLSPPPG
ncbi:MAG: hypothetical protein M0Z48_03005 [Nitrospiraceae bacterium]|nr:hypothetical protein [Nitrospiraceae bacterium]